MDFAVPLLPLGSHDAFLYLVETAPANPFALRWIPAATPAYGNIGQLTRVVHSASPAGSIPQANGAAIHPGTNPGISPPSARTGQTQQLIVAPEGEVLFPPGTVLEPNPEIVAQQLGVHASLLKVRVHIALGNSRTTHFDADIGAGFSTTITSKWINAVEVLVPDPTSIPAQLPADYVERELASVIATACYTCQYPNRGAPLIYSQSFFLADGVGEATMPRVPSSQQVLIYASTTEGAAADTRIEFLSVTGAPVVATIGPTGMSSVLLGQLSIVGGLAQVMPLPIPGATNAFRIVKTQPPNIGMTLTIVQVLG